MELDLNKGIYIKIGGELGKYNTLPLDILIKILQSFQDLIMVIAKYDLPGEELVDFNNFKLELFDFKKLSADPGIAFTPRSENKVGHNWELHRNIVSLKFDQIASVSDSGDYIKLLEFYPEPQKRNPIVDSLFNFVNNFGSAPATFSSYDELTDSLLPIKKISKFKSGTKNELLTNIKELEPMVSESDEGVGKIKIINKNGKISKRIMDCYPANKFSLNYAPNVIQTQDKKYHLKYRIRCLFEKEENYFVIQNELLHITGTGVTENEAQSSFAEEFEYTFNKLNSIDDKNLTERNIFIKNLINQVILKVEG